MPELSQATFMALLNLSRDIGEKAMMLEIAIVNLKAREFGLDGDVSGDTVSTIVDPGTKAAIESRIAALKDACKPMLEIGVALGTIKDVTIV
jgi:hypothetical protein